ncbi:MAG: hypothetical protein ACI92I_000519 [Acidimicrobiales bacterium]|jgi:hypothetical protein
MKRVNSLFLGILLTLMIASVGSSVAFAATNSFTDQQVQDPDTLVPDGGLVPAGRDGNYSAEGYGSCEFVEMANNITKFLVGVSALIAVIVFIYAGYLMVYSGGDTGQIQQAKGLFSNVAIGFVILLTAFLVVNTILGVMVGSKSGILNWQTIECQYAVKPADPKKLAIDAQEHVYQGYVSPFTPVITGDMPTAGSGDGASCNSSKLTTGDKCYAANRCSVGNVKAACPRIGVYSAEIEAAARKYGVPASRIRGIMITESGGNPNARSPVGALGLMQIMPATGRASCGLSVGDLLVPAKNIDCGASYYAQQYRSFGSHDLAAAAYNAGPGRNGPSRDCPGLTQWQCPFNSGGCCVSGAVTNTSCSVNTGFQETRHYVDKVNGASPACGR